MLVERGEYSFALNISSVTPLLSLPVAISDKGNVLNNFLGTRITKASKFCIILSEIPKANVSGLYCS